MGSRIMHIAIGKRVSEMISIDNPNDFIIGSVAIDWVRDKDLSHFYRGITETYTRHIDYSEFYETYSHENDAFKLGCFAHLIADDLWLQGMYLPWLRHLIKRTVNSINYHPDFEVLNYLLAKYYDLEGLLNTLKVPSINLTSYLPIEFGDFNKLINQLKADIENRKDGQLTVFTFEQIIGYIETSAEKIVYKIKTL